MEKDPLVHSLGPLAEIDDWKAFLSSQPDGIEELRLHTSTGRPLGGESFVNLAEALTGRFQDPEIRYVSPEFKGMCPPNSPLYALSEGSMLLLGENC